MSDDRPAKPSTGCSANCYYTWDSTISNWRLVVNPRCSVHGWDIGVLVDVPPNPDLDLDFE